MTPNGRIQLALPDLFGELDGLATCERMPVDPDFPFVLSAGERRSFTANTIVRNPGWRRKDPEGALRIHPEDGQRLGLGDGSTVRLTTHRGSTEVRVELSDRMQPGHVSLPNGTGLAHPNAGGIGGDGGIGGVAPNELTSLEDRDPIAGTPWHKSCAARIEAV